MIKICYVTTIAATFKAFIIKAAEYIHANTDWDISVICNTDETFSTLLPEYIHYYPVRMERGISLSGLKAIIEMKKIFEREQFDLIQYSTPNASLYASVASKLVGTPVRLYCQWGMAYVGFYGIKRKMFKAIEKFVCTLSTHIEPDSNSNLSFAHAEGLYSSSKGNVIWHGSACGVDLKKFDYNKKSEFKNKIRSKYGIGENSFVYGFVGRITHDKGINELLQACKEMFTDKDYLMIIGPNEADDTIDRELFKWAKTNNHVIFSGYTNHVEEYLSAMDCYILPSYREGFGMGVVEAEAMGVPVIVTDIPGPIDAMIPNSTGLLIEKGNVIELRSAMSYLNNNHDACTLFGSNGYEYAKVNFEQETLFKHILNDRMILVNKQAINTY